jgi:hypothetical protein
MQKLTIKFIATLIILIFNYSFAGTAQVCSKRGILLKDCSFTLGQNKIHVWKNKIFLTNSTARDVQPLSFAAELEKDLVGWSFAKTHEQNGRYFVEISIWSLPAGQSDVESLMWSVYEIDHDHILKKIEKLIQKRKKIKDSNYKYDKLSKFGIGCQKSNAKIQSNKQCIVEWYVDHDKGLL